MTKTFPLEPFSQSVPQSVTEAYWDTDASASLACRYIYPADVYQRTYNITQPGRYCLAADLPASTPPAASLGTPSRTPTTQHTGPAIHVHVSNVEIDFGGYTLYSKSRREIEHGVFIEQGSSNISLHDGEISEFKHGIAVLTSSGAGGWSALLDVRNMRFGGNYMDVKSARIRDSVFSGNSFNAEFNNLYIVDSHNNSIASNRFETWQRSWSAYGLWLGNSVQMTRIVDNVFYGNDGGANGGLFLHNGVDELDESMQSQDNLVDSNRFYRVLKPIVSSGSGIARGNVIRDNQIYGVDEYNFVTVFTTTARVAETAIFVNNNADVEINSNVIYSGPTLAYKKGIQLMSASSVRLDASGDSTLRFNRTCGVLHPLVPPTGIAVSSIDGGNFWNLFCASEFLE